MGALEPREPVRLSIVAKLGVAREQDADRLLAILADYERECFALADWARRTRARLISNTPGLR